MRLAYNTASSLTSVCLLVFEPTTHFLPFNCNATSCWQVQQGKGVAMKQATTAKRQAQASKVEVQAGMHEQQKLKTVLENVLVLPSLLPCLQVHPSGIAVDLLQGFVTSALASPSLENMASFVCQEGQTL